MENCGHEFSKYYSKITFNKLNVMPTSIINIPQIFPKDITNTGLYLSFTGKTAQMNQNKFHCSIILNITMCCENTPRIL